jgi:hypothetical protein
LLLLLLDEPSRHRRGISTLLLCWCITTCLGLLLVLLLQPCGQRGGRACFSPCISLVPGIPLKGKRAACVLIVAVTMLLLLLLLHPGRQR